MTSKTIKLLATKAQRYENRAIEAGETLMATPAVAKTLLAVKRAEVFVEGKGKKAKVVAQPAPAVPAEQKTEQPASTAVAPMTTLMGESNEYSRRDLKAQH